MNKTGIPWATHVWNPIKGCSPVSEGCTNCYAKREAEGRLKRCGIAKYQDGFQVRFFPNTLDQPLHRWEPARIFIGSMGDIFHDRIPDSFIMEIFRTAKEAADKNGHKFMLLTKRPLRMLRIMKDVEKEMGVIQGLYIGVTIENSLRFWDRWIPLLDAPADGRFVSFEPLLSPIRVFDVIPHRRIQRTIDLAIIGCESGNNRRPCRHEWAKDLAYGFRLLGIPIFIKQLSRNPDGSGAIIKMPKIGGIVHDQIPEGLRIG